MEYGISLSAAKSAPVLLTYDKGLTTNDYCIPHILCIFATGIHASRKIPYFLYIIATGILASREIPHILYITSTGVLPPAEYRTSCA